MQVSSFKDTTFFTELHDPGWALQNFIPIHVFLARVFHSWRCNLRRILWIPFLYYTRLKIYATNLLIIQQGYHKKCLLIFWKHFLVLFSFLATFFGRFVEILEIFVGDIVFVVSSWAWLLLTVPCCPENSIDSIIVTLLVQLLFQREFCVSFKRFIPIWFWQKFTVGPCRTVLGVVILWNHK